MIEMVGGLLSLQVARNRQLPVDFAGGTVQTEQDPAASRGHDRMLQRRVIRADVQAVPIHDGDRVLVVAEFPFP